MLRKWIGIASVIAMAAVLLAADASQARERRLFGRRNRGSDYDTSTYVVSEGAVVASSDMTMMPSQERRLSGRRNRGTAYGSNAYVAPNGAIMPTSDTPGVQRRSDYYSPEGSRVTGSEMPVIIDVLTPATAEITFEGAKTTQTGSRRLFISPPIKSGQNYIYEINVKWLENGKPIAHTRKLPVRAGQRLMVDLTREMPTNQQ
jgi:uncharacterized protein (TIGR03000 family)